MTAKDRERGYSYESRYPLLGLYPWAELEAIDLPNWAVPTWNEQFSVLHFAGWFDTRFATLETVVSKILRLLVVEADERYCALDSQEA
jgi:hypothetical protein